MAWRCLGQANPDGAVLTPLLVMNEDKQVTCSSLQVCNQGPDASFRVALIQDGAVVSTKDYLYYDEPIRSNRSFVATVGWTLSDNCALWIYASHSRMSFNLFGVEIDEDSE